MAAYIVATVVISDLDKFKEYSTTIAGISESYGGESIVKGIVKDMLEGEGPEQERIVVTRFPDENAARAYVKDETYLAGKEKRSGAAIVNMRLLVD